MNTRKGSLNYINTEESNMQREGKDEYAQKVAKLQQQKGIEHTERRKKMNTRKRSLNYINREESNIQREEKR